MSAGKRESSEKLMNCPLSPQIHKKKINGMEEILAKFHIQTEINLMRDLIFFFALVKVFLKGGLEVFFYDRPIEATTRGNHPKQPATAT